MRLSAGTNFTTIAQAIMAHISGETAYLFRHAIMRDAAYNLQPQSERSQLHALAAALIEAMPGPGLEAVAGEISDHLRLAREWHDSAAMLDSEQRMSRLAGMHAEATFQHSAAIRYWLRCADISTGGAAGRALTRAGVAVMAMGDTTRAGGLFQRALQLACDAGDTAEEANTLGSIGVLQKQSGHADGAAETYARAIALQKKVGNLHGVAAMISNLVNLKREFGSFAECEVLIAEGMAMARQHGHRGIECLLLLSSSELELDRGNFGAATELNFRCLELSRAIKARRTEGQALGNRASLLKQERKFDQSGQTYLEGLKIARETGSRFDESVILGNIAGLYTEMDEFDKADDSYRQALALQREIGNKRSEAVTLSNLASLQLGRGIPEQALPTAELALQLARQIRYLALESHAACHLALIYLHFRRDDEALALAQRALAIDRQLGLQTEEGRDRCALALVQAYTANAASSADWEIGLARLLKRNAVTELQELAAILQSLSRRRGDCGLSISQRP